MIFKEASTGFEPVDTGVADHCLTTWLRRRTYNDSRGNRTPVTAVKGRCLDRLTMEPYHAGSESSGCTQFPAAPQVGLEPTTTRLTAECSTIELLRNKNRLYLQNCILSNVSPMAFSPQASGSKFYLALRPSCGPISSSQLHALLRFHLCPIYLVVFKGSMISHLEGGFTLRCLQRLSRPDTATQLCSWQNNWCTGGPSIPVLSY